MRENRIPAIVDNGTDLKLERAVAKAEKIAAKLRLPPNLLETALANNPDGFSICSDDVIRGSSVGDDSPLWGLDRSPSFFIEELKTVEQSEFVNEVFSAELDRDEMSRIGRPWMARSNGDRTVLAARRQGANAPEGVFVFSHKAELLMEQREFWLKFHIELENIYVTPSARGTGVAHALVACLIEGFRDDVRFYQKVFEKGDKRILKPVQIGFSVGGDIHSNGGRHVSEIVTYCMTEIIEDEFSLEEMRELLVGPLEEDFEDIHLMDGLRGLLASQQTTEPSPLA